MKYIKHLKDLELTNIFKSEQNKEVNILCSRGALKLLEVNLSENATLPKHSAPSPITVLCLAGHGIFKAGENGEDEQILNAGTLIYLEKDIPHEVNAQPNLRILVTKLS